MASLTDQIKLVLNLESLDALLASKELTHLPRVIKDLILSVIGHLDVLVLAERFLVLHHVVGFVLSGKATDVLIF